MLSGKAHRDWLFRDNGVPIDDMRPANWGPRTGKDQLLPAMKGHALAVARLIGTYGKGK